MFLGGALPTLPLLALLVRIVDRCRPIISLGLAIALGVGGGAAPISLAHASQSALSFGFLLGINFFLLFVIFGSSSIGKSMPITGISVNSQCIVSI